MLASWVWVLALATLLQKELAFLNYFTVSGHAVPRLFFFNISSNFLMALFFNYPYYEVVFQLRDWATFTTGQS